MNQTYNTAQQFHWETHYKLTPKKMTPRVRLATRWWEAVAALCGRAGRRDWGQRAFLRSVWARNDVQLLPYEPPKDPFVAGLNRAMKNRMREEEARLIRGK